MSTSGRTILKNASFLLLSQGVTWSLALVLTFVMARVLGPEALGELQLSTALWAILAMVITFGMDVVVIKEVARHPERIGELAGTLLALQAVMFVGALILLTLYLTAVHYSAQVVTIILIISISSLLYEMQATFDGLLQGLERMEYVSLGAVAGRVGNTVLILTVLGLGYGVKAVALVGIAGPVTSLLVEWSVIRRLYQLRLTFKWDVARWLIRSGAPFFLSGVFLVLYANLDVVFVSLFANETVVGWYGAAARLVGSLVFLPVVMQQAIFPAAARLHGAPGEELPKLIRRSLNWLLAISVPLGVGTALVARPVVILFYGDKFQPTGDILALMGLVIIFLSTNILLGKFLTATERQNRWTVTMAVAVALTIPMDYVLIPWCQRVLGNGGIGGALSYLVTETVMTVVALRLLPKGLLVRSDLWQAARVFLAGGLMAASVWLCRDLPLVIQIGVGVLVYLPAAALLRAVPLDELVVLGNIAGGLARQVRARLLTRAA